MNLRTRLVVRSILAHPWRSTLSSVGIAVGIAVVLAIDIANESARKGFRMSNDAVAGGSTHYIHGGPAGIDERIYTDLRVEHGLRNINPVVSGYVTVDQRRFLLLGIDPLSTNAGNQSGPANGNGFSLQLLQTEDAVVMLAASAAALGIDVPGRITIQIGGVTRILNLVDTIQPANALQRHGLRGVVIADIATAQSILGMVGRLSRIDVDTDDPVAMAGLLPTPLKIIPNEMRSQAMEQMTRAFHLNLTALSLLAMVIGAFLIYNTMTLSVLQRRERFAVLRALGVTHRQLFGDIIFEALVLACIGFVLGAVMGTQLSHWLVRMTSGTINDLYFVAEVQAVSIPPSSFAKAAALALVATVVSAWHPAWEAMRTTPIANSVRSNVETDAKRRSTKLAGAGIILWGIATIILVVSERSIVAGFVALFLIIIGFTLVTPVVLLQLSRLMNPLLSKSLGLIGRMAGRGVRAALSRTQVAVAALAVAVSAVVGVNVMILSFRASVEDWLDKFLLADVYIAQQHSHQQSGIDRTLIAEIAAMTGVRSITTGRWVELQSTRGITRLFTVNASREGFRNFQLINGGTDDIWDRFTEENTVIVSEPYAYHNDIDTGDTIALSTDGGDVAFKVAGVFYDYGSDRGVVAMHRATYNRHWRDRVVSSFALYLRSGTDAESFVDQLNRRQLINQTLRVRSNSTIRQTSLRIFDRTFVVTDVLRLLAIIIAIMGIMSALTAIHLERAKEFAVLRATGFSVPQLWGLITTESGVMGLIAGIVACPLGLVMAWVLIFIINRRSFGWTMGFSFEPEPWITALVLSILAAIAAGLYPAFRMARSSAADALKYE